MPAKMNALPQTWFLCLSVLWSCLTIPAAFIRSFITHDVTSLFGS